MVDVPFLDALKSPGQAFADVLLDEARRRGISQDALAALSGALRGGLVVPNTRLQSTHALSLRVGRVPIGGVFELNPSQRRTVEREYEIEAGAVGHPVDVWGETLEQEVTLSRFDLWFAPIEAVFGTRELETLCDQHAGVTLRKRWRGPAGVLSGGVYAVELTGCWFQSLGRQLRADDDRSVRVNATLAVTGRRVLR